MKSVTIKKIAFIPARYAATRFPAKLMQQLGNKTVIRHTYDNTVNTLMQILTEKQYIVDPNYVKVAVDKNMNSLLFSRSPIPYHRDKTVSPIYYEHIGVYAFRKQALLNFSNWQMTPLEVAEKIECLRYLENGVPLKMVITEYMGVEIDTPEDLEKAIQLLK